MARRRKETGRTPEQAMKALRFKAKMLYDLQRLRIQAQGRITKKAKGGEVQLHDLDKLAMTTNVKHFLSAEKAMLLDVTKHLSDIPFYRDVLCDPTRWKGIGPGLWAVLLSEINIELADTPSKIWAFAGLSVVPAMRCRRCHQVVSPAGKKGYLHPVQKGVECELAGKHLHSDSGAMFESGQAQRPTKGEKLPYNAWLRAKLCGVMGGTILRASRYYCAECDVEVTRKKEPKASEKAAAEVEGTDDDLEVGDIGAKFLHPAATAGDVECQCVGRDLTVEAGEVVRVDSPWRLLYENYKHRKESQGWGKNPGHRHRAAIRYMVKMLLLEFWKEWRSYEGLPVRESYQEQYLGHVHGAGAQAGV